MQVRETTFSETKEIAQANAVKIPIEQTQQWAQYQSTIDGRSQWKTILVEDNNEPICFANFILFKTHGFNYLRSCHGPVWFVDRDEALEEKVSEAIGKYVRSQDSSIVFIRMAVKYSIPSSKPVLSTTPYDTTVLVDVQGEDEDVLMRMNTRGRRNVRKALREAPIMCCDETDLGLDDFTPYYQLMVETAQRDGFTPAVQSDYENMLVNLGKEHARLFAGRDEESNELACWGIYTMNDNSGVYYYAAGSSDYRKRHRAANDKLVFLSLMKLSELGCTEVDLMGIGSDFCPELNGLTPFKTKFSKNIVSIAPDRDIPLRRAYYNLLVLARKILRKG